VNIATKINFGDGLSVIDEGGGEITVNAGGGGNGEAGPWITPTLLNGWMMPDPASDLHDIRYRRGSSPDQIEFEGHMQNGATDTVAFILESEFLVAYTRDFLTSIQVGSFFTLCRIVINASGEVMPQFPDPFSVS
jgi:hypothetical protein